MYIVAHVSESGKKCDVWRHMAGGAAAGKDDAFHNLKPPDFLYDSIFNVSIFKKFTFSIELKHYHIFQSACSA